MGIFLFWLQYIIAAIVLYHILRCLYIKGETSLSRYGNEIYTKTDNDERLKHPLWLVLIFFIVFLIPVLNIIILSSYLAFRVICDGGESRNPYYCKSALTKKY